MFMNVNFVHKKCINGRARKMARSLLNVDDITTCVCKFIDTTQKKSFNMKSLTLKLRYRTKSTATAAVYSSDLT